jgi:acetyltransferase-like isoleucine patch superfamily enzyme
MDWVSVQHPMSWVAPEASLGPGTVVCAGAIVQPDAVVGAHVILNSSCIVEHDARVADFAHLSNAHLGARSSAGEGALLAMGSIVIPDVLIGPWAIVGAGSVVTRDVHPGVTAVGIPARPITRRTTGVISVERPSRLAVRLGI